MVTCALAACGSTATAPPWFVRTYLGAPSGVALTDGGPVVAWGPANQMDVVAWGSSGCPKLPIDMKASGNTLTLTLSSGTSPNGGACTTDLAPTTTVIHVPESVDQTRPVSFAFVNAGSSRTTFVLSPRSQSG